MPVLNAPDYKMNKDKKTLTKHKKEKKTRNPDESAGVIEALESTHQNGEIQPDEGIQADINETLHRKKKKDKRKKDEPKEVNEPETPEKLTKTEKKEKKSRKHKSSLENGINEISEPCSNVKTEPIDESETSKPSQTEVDHIFLKDNSQLTISPKSEKKEKKLKKLKSELAEESVAVVKSEPVADDDFKPLSQDELDGSFEKFKLLPETVMKLKAQDIHYLFPIQYRTYDFVYGGDDVIAQARTGTGKTLSFALPIIEKLQLEENKRVGCGPVVLVLTPTRELANQVCADFAGIAPKSLNVFSIYGGVSYEPQEFAIRNGIDVLVGTPGRIWDFLENRRRCPLRLDGVKHVILDEVDRMLDMGFAEIVENILGYAYKDSTKKPQTMLFSATLPPWVHKTAQKYMSDKVQHVDLIGREQIRTATTVEHLSICCSYYDRASVIGDLIQVYSGKHGRAMVFTQTKKDADELAVNTEDIKLDRQVLHGDIPQPKREKVLQSFKSGQCKVLLTTDVAARGLDIPNVDLVIQCQPPKDLDSYIHRSGRTGRAGRSGKCICFFKPNEARELASVEHRAGIKFRQISSPTPDEIIQALSTDAFKSLDSIPTKTLDRFRDTATKLIEDRGAVDALAAALAVMSGNTDLHERSLLGCQAGYTTYVMNSNIALRSSGYCVQVMRRCLPNVGDKLGKMRLTKDRMSCVFDLPSDQNDYIARTWTDGIYDKLEIATELPELDVDPESFRSNDNRFGRRGGAWGNRRGGGGGWRGGFKRSFNNNSAGGSAAKRIRFG